jgi:hypothetical protein
MWPRLGDVSSVGHDGYINGLRLLPSPILQQPHSTFTSITTQQTYPPNNTFNMSDALLVLSNNSFLRYATPANDHLAANPPPTRLPPA